jgi:predicted alpha-1,2-mannosidase
MPSSIRRTAFIVVFFALVSVANAQVAGDRVSRLTQWVDPFVGVDAGGNTVPGAAVPFGFVELSPDTVHGSTNGYSSHGQILGFSHTHVSGTGGGSKYGNFRVTPTVGAVSVGNLKFAKSDEQASPGYYAVTLAAEGGNIRCELTASRLAGLQRFLFPVGPEGNLILDITSHVMLSQRATHAEATFLDDTHIAGSASFVGGWNSGAYTLYFYAEFNRPARRVGTWAADQGLMRLNAGQKHIEGDQKNNYQNRVGTFAVFDTTKDRAVQMKLAVSFISVEKARTNLEQEMPDWDFESVRSSAENSWEQVLKKIEVSGGTESQRRIFYSALYRTHYMPHDLTGENVWWQSSEPHYEDFYTLWDTFRTVHPLFTLIQPERQRDMVRSLVDTYRHTGWLPDARIAGANGSTQGGSNGDVLVADAIVKGMTGFDYQTAYEALVKDAEVESTHPINEGRQLEEYKRLGYMSLNHNRSASRTLEYAYNDFCISEVARALGKNDDAEKYLKQSSNWTKLWNPEKRCIHPRYADGRWLENFECSHEYPDGTTEWWDVPFYEGSSLQYSVFVPHDVHGLIQRVGGDEAFTKWLDELFDRKFYNPGNEPDIMAPYLYIHAGRPDRVADRVRTLLDTEYREGRRGLPGNDDAGTMSSWYVWSAVGIFPNAGQSFYYIGSSLFKHVSVDVGSGRAFVIDAPESSASNRYIQSAELNGKPLIRAWLTHAEVATGGYLVLNMGATPSKWGGVERPPSVSYPVSSAVSHQ